MLSSFFFFRSFGLRGRFGAGILGVAGFRVEDLRAFGSGLWGFGGVKQFRSVGSEVS